MEKFTILRSQAMPLRISDVDTDMIIPAQYMTSVSREGYGNNLFRRLREADPSFPLNQERYAGSQIIVAPVNFGCGSSREHAVWALKDAGFRVVICSSFADIFAGNAAKNGLLLIELEQEAVNRLLEAASMERLEIEVDLEKQTVSLDSGTTYKFEYDPFRKYCLLEGQDDLDYLLSNGEKINEFRAAQALEQPLPDTRQLNGALK